MVSMITLTSRVCHLSAAAYLIGASAYPLLVTSTSFADIPGPAPITFMYAVAVLVLSGLYNAGAAKPSAMLPGTAGLWRGLVYGLKAAMVASCSPLLARVSPDPVVQTQVRLACCLLGLAAGSYARYYREDNQPRPAPNAKQS